MVLYSINMEILIRMDYKMEGVLLLLKTNWLTIFLSALSIVLSLIIAKTYANKKTLNIYCKTQSVYSESQRKKISPKLAFTYDGVCINQIYKTIFILWNSGNQLIDKSDVLNKNPLEINIKENEIILDVNIKSVTREACDICINNEAQKAIIEFDFLDKQDGMLLEILHTDILIIDEWIIKGVKVKKCKEISDFKSKKLVSKISSILMNSGFIMGMSIMLLSSIILLITRIFEGNLTLIQLMALLLVIIAIMGTIWGFFCGYVPFILSPQPPKSLIFSDDDIY